LICVPTTGTLSADVMTKLNSVEPSFRACRRGQGIGM
jgi:hypothetical protein